MRTSTISKSYRGKTDLHTPKRSVLYVFLYNNSSLTIQRFFNNEFYTHCRKQLRSKIVEKGKGLDFLVRAFIFIFFVASLNCLYSTSLF